MTGASRLNACIQGEDSIAGCNLFELSQRLADRERIAIDLLDPFYGAAGDLSALGEAL